MIDPEISIVIPVYNEEGNVDKLGLDTLMVMRALGKPFELIFVNDGSEDATRSKLAALGEKNSEVITLNLDQRIGQSLAIEQGVKLSRSEIIVNMDGDCQNDPTDIPKLLDGLKNAHIVNGIRKNRKDTFAKKASARIAFLVRNTVLKDGVLDIGCGIKAYKKSCLSGIKWFNGIHRFLPAILEFKGFRLAQVEVNHFSRMSGRSHYSNLKRAFKGLKDLLYVAQLKRKIIKGIL